MTVPTVFDFAMIYPAPMPANIVKEFDKLSDQDRVGAVTLARRVKATVRSFNSHPLCPLKFLAMKPWRDRMQGEGGQTSNAFLRYPCIAPHVHAALPSHDGEPLSAKQIWEKANFGTIATTRAILAEFAREGVAIAADVARIEPRAPMRVYRRAK